jgi:uncharacterized protein (TIGR02217 family)
MAFFELEFPRQIGYKRLGSPSGFSTQVNQGFSGQEQRNRNWANSHGKWTIDIQTPSAALYPGTRQSYVDLLTSFHLVCGGRADAFRLKDHLDAGWTTAQPLATIDSTHFQLQKQYVIGTGSYQRTYTRTITKPITSAITDFAGNALANTVTIAVGGTPVGSGWTLDQTTGIVTFSSAPGGAVTSPSGQFHYPARFDSDDLPLQVEESYVEGGQMIVSLHGLQLVEVLPPNY